MNRKETQNLQKLTVTITPAARRKLKGWAGAHDTSASAAVEMLVARYLDALETDGAPA